ncbi:MAG: zf-HC2 domain-containing protein [Armatimonadota bacterium]
MTCEQCAENLTGLIEGDLSPEDERVMREHIDGCPGCARALAETRSLVEALRSLPEVDAPADLRERLRSIPERAEPATYAWWRRSRTVIASVTAAAAAALLMWTGVVHYQQEAGQPPAPMVAERTVPPSDEMPAESRFDAATDREEAGEPAAETVEGDSAEMEAEVSDAEPVEAGGAPTAGSHGAESDSRRERRMTRAPEAASSPTRSPDATPQTEAGPEPASPSAAETAPIAPPSMRSTPPAPDEMGVDAPDTASTGESRISASDSDGAAGAGPQGPAGPAGPAGNSMRSMTREAPEPAYSREPLRVPGPMYLDAGEGAASARVGEGTPFTVGVTPPHEKVTGTVLPATIRLETEADVARARVTVAGSDDLELIGLEEGGVVFDGPLTAGQQMVLSVRMLSRETGAQSITLRLRSTDPIVDTQLDVRMGDFTEPVAPAERPVQFDFVGVPIREAVSEVTRQSGMSVIVDPGVGEATVTARADDPVPAAAGLRAVAEAAGLTVTERDGRSVVEMAGEQD